MHMYLCMVYKSVNIVKLSLAEIINDILVVILYTLDLSKSLSTAIHGSIWRSGIECILC